MRSTARSGNKIEGDAVAPRPPHALVDEVCECFGDRPGAHVAAGDGPLVVLLGEEGADEPEDRGSAGEDDDDVGAAADLLDRPPRRDQFRLNAEIASAD
jgi:hypothetical protein